MTGGLHHNTVTTTTSHAETLLRRTGLRYDALLRPAAAPFMLTPSLAKSAGPKQTPEAPCCCLSLQFPFQPDQPPVPCSCGSRNCRRRMN
jgi:hypothetical protein